MRLGEPLHELALVGGVAHAEVAEARDEMRRPSVSVWVANRYFLPASSSWWVAVALRGGQTAARIPLEAHALGLVSLLLAAIRAHGEIDWSNPLAMLLATGVAGMLILDAYLIATARPSAAAR